MIISNNKRFIYIHLYKTGGTSIRQRLEKYDASYTLWHRVKSALTKSPVLPPTLAPKHASARQIRSLLGAELYHQYFSFVFVRNPWDWQVSLFNYIRRGGDRNNKHYNIIKSFKNFDEYIRWRCTVDVHLQKEHIIDDNGDRIVDFIGKFETLDKDFETICKTLGLITEQLPHLNSSNTKNHRSYYTTETRAMVENAYQEDIELFGYEY